MNKNSPNNNRILFGLLIAVVLMLPWFHGGEVNWQFNLFQIVIFISFGIFVLTYQNHAMRKNEFGVIKSVRIPLFLLATLVVLTFFQTLNLPLSVIEILAPNVASQYQDTSQILGSTETLGSLSIAKSNTIQAGFNQASYLAIFIFTLLVVNTRRRATALITILFGTAVLTAIHAIINYNTEGGFFYIKALPPWQASDHKIIHGPFSYKNHFASFLILTIPLGFGLLFYNKTKKTKNRTLKTLNYILSKRGVLTATCSFMLAILIFNTSRAGLVALSVSMLLSVLFYFYLNPKKFHLKKIGVTAIGILFLLIVIIMSGLSDRLLERVSNYGENGRDTMRSTTLTIIHDHWLLGTGAGTFPNIQHNYKSEILSGHKMWQHAHNDYLEMLSNQGVVGAGLLGIAILYLLCNLILSIKNNHNSLRSIQIACLCSTSAVLIHSFFDFNFQLPVNVVYFYIILAIGLKAPWLKS